MSNQIVKRPLPFFNNMPTNPRPIAFSNLKKSFLIVTKLTTSSISVSLINKVNYHRANK